MNELDFTPRSDEAIQTPPIDNVGDATKAVKAPIGTLDAATLEQGVLDSPEEPQIPWPESNPDGTISEADYLKRCRWRLGNVSHALDVVRNNIDNEADARKWLELKMAVLAAKSLNNHYEMVDLVIIIEEAGQAFTTHLNIDMDAYQRAANK